MTNTTEILVPLYNRKADGTFQLPEDNWYQLAPYGEFPHTAGKVNQVIDKVAAQKMSSSFSNEMPQGQPGLLVDYEHYAHSPDGSTEAAGWIEGLQARDDGLYANIRWTTNGLEAVKGGKYRFISPTWFREQCEDLGNGKLRPTRLNDAALTNLPNLKGMKPLSDKANNPGDNSPQPKTQMKNKIVTMLGLDAEATDEAVLSALTILQNKANQASEEIGKLAEKLTALENSNKSLREFQLEVDVAKYSARIKPENLEAIKKQLLDNREATVLMLESILDPTPPPAPSAPAPMHNRSAAAAPAVSTDPRKIFENAVKEELKTAPNKSTAISNSIRKNPEAYKAWRAEGGPLNL
jgi:phage I-like protein